MKKTDADRLARLVSAFRGRKVAVLGDIMLDRYIKGSVRRISPEAPVPVVRVRSERTVAGGAGNVAANLAALGASVSLISLAGQDAGAAELAGILEAGGIDASRLLSDPCFSTIEKTRVVAEHQQVVRFDREPDFKMGHALRARLLDALSSALSAGAAAVVFSDYGKGLLEPGVISAASELCRRKRVPVFVDPKVEHFARYKGVTCITPNTMEACQGMHAPVRDSQDHVEEIGRRIMAELKPVSLLITQGEHGMTLFTRKAGRVSSVNIPTKAREVFDVTGAGDTVISTLALAAAAGAGLYDAALVSNFAAGIVVGKLGTAVVTPDELVQQIRSWAKTA